MAERPARPSSWLATPVEEVLRDSGRWLLLLALPLAMTTPRIDVGGVHVTASDLLGVLGGICWLVASFTRSVNKLSLAGAKWPRRSQPIRFVRGDAAPSYGY